MRLALIDNDKQHLHEAVAQLKLADHDVLAIEADVSDYDQMLKAAEQVKSKFGKVNVLCLNAGVGMEGATCSNGKIDVWRKVSAECEPGPLKLRPSANVRSVSSRLSTSIYLA